MEKSSQREDIVIVGGGICGLATALALHRKGIKSLVLEKSEKLRATGSAIIIQTNGWRALDQLGVASTLRKTALQIYGRKVITTKDNDEATEMAFRVCEEFRVIKRIELMKVMADNLPEGTIRTGSKVISVQLDPLTNNPQLMLSNGNVLQAKVVVGCDGVNSIVANIVKSSESRCVFNTSVARGFTNYANGHQFASEFVTLIRDEVQLGRIPITDHLVYWFVTRPRTQQDSTIWKDPGLIRESLMESLEGFPANAMEIIANSELNSLHLTDLKYRPPWPLLFNNFRKSTITVAGDAMHATGPFIGQGGSASIEDAVVLARCLSLKTKMNKKLEVAAQEAIDEYVKERRMRLFWLSLQTYVIGKKLDFKQSLVRKLIFISLLVVLFRDLNCHTYYDCGTL